MIDPGRRDSLRNVHFLRSRQSPRKSPPANGGAKACQAPDGFREQNRREKTCSARLLLQTRVGRHGQSAGESALPRCIVSNLRAIGIFSLFSDELPTCARQPRAACVRNVVGGHFVAFTRSANEKTSMLRVGSMRKSGQTDRGCLDRRGIWNAVGTRQ